MSIIIKRTTIVVRDIERAKHFYTDLLGFTPWYDREFTFSGAMPGTTKGDKSQLVIVQAQDPEIGKIGLLQFTDPVKKAPPPRDIIDVGSVVFVGSVPSVDALNDRRVAEGHPVASPPHDFTVTGADGKEKTMRRICFFDLDGNFFELNE